MEDYTANSDKSKNPPESPPEKNLTQVVTGEVIKKPEGLGKKFRNTFLGGDFRTAREYLISDVLLPALRNLVVDTVSKGVDRIVYGDSAVRRRGPVNYAPRVSYHSPVYRDPRTRSGPPGQNPTGWSQGRRGSDEFILATKADADAVVDQMITVVDQYDVVSLADLHELLGLPSSHTDNKWGWTHLGNIQVNQVREGYKITFPPLEEIS